MLIIARRKGESIVIGDDVEIVVTEVSRTTVKLAISAPRGRRVLRGEVHRSIEAVNKSAAETALDQVAKAVAVQSADAVRPLSASTIGATKVTPARQASDAETSHEDGRAEAVEVEIQP